MTSTTTTPLTERDRLRALIADAEAAATKRSELLCEIEALRDECNAAVHKTREKFGAKIEPLQTQAAAIDLAMREGKRARRAILDGAPSELRGALLRACQTATSASAAARKLRFDGAMRQAEEAERQRDEARAEVDRLVGEAMVG